MIVAVCQLLYKDSPSSMHVLCNAGTWVRSKPSDGFTLFAEGCYVFTSCSTPTKISILRYLFKELNILPSELEFELMPVVEDAVTDSTITPDVSFESDND